MKKVTVTRLIEKKSNGEKVTMLTAYDASFAKLFDQQGIDSILVGDSLGMVLQGNDDTLSVSIDDMVYHVRLVKKGTTRALIIADMPFMSYATTEQAYQNAAKLMAAGAQMVKLEGGDWLVETVKGLVERGIPVCAHLGLTPQSLHKFGGFKIQGREALQAEQMVEHAQALEKAGAQMLVLECVPKNLAATMSEQLTIPVIGIGAGPDTDGQVLVMHDLIGVSANYIPKFSKNFLASTGNLTDAVRAYVHDVSAGTFPGPEHYFE